MEVTSRIPHEDFWQIAHTFASNSGPYRADLTRLCRERSSTGLAHYELVDIDSSHIWHVIMARQVLALFKKNNFFCDPVSAELIAISNFMRAESMCSATNKELGTRVSGLNPDAAAVLHGTVRKISRILGPCPAVGSLEFNFSSGATTTVKRGPSSALFKLRQPGITPGMYCASEEWAHTLPHLVHRHCELVEEVGDTLAYVCDWPITPGHLQFVPKDMTKYRSIVVEPTLATAFQKGYGTYIRHRLGLAGLDLSVGQERHRRLAQRASLDGSLATVDFSMASDLISRSVVEELLPLPWVSALDTYRTRSVVYGRNSMSLQKWSSMGNGYTFELETLIFYCIALSTTEHLQLAGEVSVYGDDVILPTGAYRLFREVCEILGFIVNDEKSFVDGPFRESCGGDYLYGVDIRPMYLKDWPTYLDLFRLHNHYFRRCETDVSSDILQWIPDELRLYGPDTYGDGHLLGSFKLSCSGALRRRGYEGGYFFTYRRSAVKNASSPNNKGRNYHRLYYGDSQFSAYSAGRSQFERSPDPYSFVGEGEWKKVKQYTLARSIFNR